MNAESVLRNLRAALDAEEAVIRQDAGLLWPQLHRRLRWSPATEALTAEWAALRTDPWLRPRTRAGLDDALIGTIPAGHGPIVDLDQLSDGSLLTAGHSIRRWDLRDRTMLGEIKAGPTSISAHPSALLVAAVDRFGGVSVWNAESGSLVTQQPADGERSGGCAWSPDGQLLATSVDDFVVVWSFTDGRLRRAWRGAHLERVRDVCFTPDGGRLISGGSDQIGVWQAGDGGRVRWIKPVANDATFSVRSTPDARSIVVGGYSGRVTRFDLATGEPTMDLREHSRWALAVDVTGDGAMALSASEDGTVRTYDLTAGAAGEVLTGHTIDVRALRVLRNGHTMATAGQDGTVRLWDLSAVGSFRAPGHEERVRACALNPDQSWAVTAGVGDYVRTWDLASGDQTAERRTRTRWLDLAVGHRNAIAAVEWDGDIVAWSPDLEDEVVRIRAKHAAVASNGRRFAAVGSRLVVFKVRSWSEIASADEPGTAIAVAPENRWLTANVDGQVLLWESDLSRCTEIGNHGSRVNSCAVSPSGHFAATAGKDWTVRLWSLDECRELGAFELPVTAAERQRCADLMRGFTHEAEKPGATACRFFDEITVVVSALDGSVRVWNLATGRQEAALVLGQPILSLDSGGVIVTGDAMGGVHMLDLVGS